MAGLVPFSKEFIDSSKFLSAGAFVMPSTSTIFVMKVALVYWNICLTLYCPLSPQWRALQGLFLTTGHGYFHNFICHMY